MRIEPKTRARKIAPRVLIPGYLHTAKANSSAVSAPIIPSESNLPAVPARVRRRSGIGRTATPVWVTEREVLGRIRWREMAVPEIDRTSYAYQDSSYKDGVCAWHGGTTGN